MRTICTSYENILNSNFQRCSFKCSYNSALAENNFLMRAKALYNNDGYDIFFPLSTFIDLFAEKMAFE